MLYYRLCKGVNDFGKLIPIDEHVSNYAIDNNHDWYQSLYYYNEDQYKEFKKTGTIAGITEVVTDRLVWDFDSKDNLELARTDSVELCSRLISAGIQSNDIQICWSGRKGFAIEVQINSFLNVKEFRNIVSTLAEGLPTYDPVVSNASRIVRVPGTRHLESKLFKRPLNIDQLSNTPINMIKDWASNLDDTPDVGWNQVILPSSLNAMKFDKEVYKIDHIDTDLNFSEKPKGFTNCKFAILNGFFEEGTRSTALTALAATCKALHYPKEVTYSMCKAAARLQSKRVNADPFPKEEIWENIIETVYKPSWKGGQYSCKTDPTIKRICDSLGGHRCKAEQVFIELTDLSGKFADYAKNIEQNTVKFGIPEMDEKVQITIGMTVGLLGAPSAGKTNTLLNFLNNTSKADIPGIFFSMDMASHLVYMKLIQKHTGKQKHEVFEAYKHNPKLVAEWNEILKTEYKNIKFSFKNGSSVEDMKNDIMRHQDNIGQKIKLVGYDYLECIQGPYSDSTANSAIIANQLKDVGNELDICNLLLLQPQKHAGDPAEPLMSMRNVKGSSVIEQACSTIITIYRPGFSPITPENDKFITISTVKDRMDGLVSLDFHWRGLTGTIRSLEDEERQELRELRESIKNRKAAEVKSDGWG